jgi:hypothetical protein
MAQVVLFGPETVSLAGLRELGLVGPVALVTAGWQERESEDQALCEKLGVPVVNLRLHARSEQLYAGDRELLAAHAARQQLLRHTQDFYRIRLNYADDAARAIAVRHVSSELLAYEQEASVETLRQLDREHLKRCRAIATEYEERWRLAKRASLLSHRAELAAILKPAVALVIAGGHIASLYNRLELFDVLHLCGNKPVLAWSAGAMVLTERMVLFHDFPPYGKDIAQILDAGFGLAPGLVVLPDARRRIRSDDRAGIARFVARMAPATCVALDPGARLVISDGRIVSAVADRLTPTGEIQRGWTG